MSNGYALHPEAYTDLDEIRSYIAEHNPDAADALITEIHTAIRALLPFSAQGHRRPADAGQKGTENVFQQHNFDWVFRV